ncbi:MAG: YbaN family protein [Candidatus Thermoplasmatota archaeon]|nr:YbaN family protein [Candidatus Thermoplasmatota archaeon]
MNPVKKGVFVTVGMISLVLGLIGIFLPVLPTTPFLLLSAYLFARSSDRLHKWLLTNRVFGKYISNYVEGRGISLAHKIITLVLLWGVILSTVHFFVSTLWVRILLLVIALSVTTHILWIKTYKKEDQGS